MSGPVSKTGLLDLAHFSSWLAHGERGMSSEAIVSHLTGQQVGRHGGRADYPHDPSDFHRCQLLLEAYPLAQMMFSSMRSASPVWARLVDAWEQIDEAIRSEVPDYLHGRVWGQRASKGYHLLRRVIDDGVECAGCNGTGRGADCEECNGNGKRSGGRCRAARCSRGYHLRATCRGEGHLKRPESPKGGEAL